MARDQLALTSFLDSSLGALQTLLAQQNITETSQAGDVRQLALGLVDMLSLATRDLAQTTGFFLTSSVFHQRDAYMAMMRPEFRLSSTTRFMLRALAWPFPVWRP